MIKIVNDGPDIEATNYFHTPHARNGFLFVSWNAGALRLLVPDSMLAVLAEMRTGKIAVVTRGLLERRDALEILFDDETANPYAVHVLMEQCDRIIPDSESGRRILVAAWGRYGKLAEWPGCYRTAEHLPCLDPWVEH